MHINIVVPEEAVLSCTLEEIKPSQPVHGPEHFSCPTHIALDAEEQLRNRRVSRHCGGDRGALSPDILPASVHRGKEQVLRMIHELAARCHVMSALAAEGLLIRQTFPQRNTCECFRPNQWARGIHFRCVGKCWSTRLYHELPSHTAVVFC